MGNSIASIFHLKKLEMEFLPLKDQIRDAFDQKLANQISFLSEIEASLPSLELTLPQQTFKNELTIHGTYRTAQLVTFGGGHSYCDAFLYTRGKSNLYGGFIIC